eukprot:458481_1
MAYLNLYDNHLRDLLITGYCNRFRGIFNDDMDNKLIHSIITSFYPPYYPKWIVIDEDKNEDDYKGKITFGDIVSKAPYSTSAFSVVDENNKLIEVGRTWSFSCGPQNSNLSIEIPYKICKHLLNAVEFYSKLNETGMFENGMNRYNVSLKVRCNDDFIIKTFGGPLNSQYKEISVTLGGNSTKKNYEFSTVTIHLATEFMKVFNVDKINKFKITNKDITDFMNMRKDEMGSKQLVKFKVYKLNNYAYNDIPDLYSSQWEMHSNCSEYYMFIGPKKEKQAMLDIIKRHYKNKCRIKMDEINELDYCSSIYSNSVVTHENTKNDVVDKDAISQTDAYLDTDDFFNQNLV